MPRVCIFPKHQSEPDFGIFHELQSGPEFSVFHEPQSKQEFDVFHKLQCVREFSIFHELQSVQEFDKAETYQTNDGSTAMLSQTGVFVLKQRTNAAKQIAALKENTLTTRFMI